MREIVIACGDYDRTAALVRHTLSLDGVRYRCLPIPAPEIFPRMLTYAEFDVAEMSLGSYCSAVGQGDERFVAIPVFLSRAFRHGNLFVREDSDVAHPSQLKGRRVGMSEYEQTASVWVRAFLADDYGVTPRDMECVVAREGKTLGRPLAADVRITLRRGLDLEAALLAGELDAYVATGLPRRLGAGVRRLIADYPAVEQDYFQRTGVFPIMHTLVLRREVYAAWPWLARSLFKAFSLAKRAAEQRMGQSGQLAYTLPWLVWHVEQTRSLMGPEPWPYGLEENRPTLETFTRHLFEQGLTERRLSLDTLFLPVEQRITAGE